MCSRTFRNLTLALAGLISSLLAPASEIDAKLKELGIEIPKTNAPVANYVPAVRSGNLVFLAGAIAKNQDGSFVKGKLGIDTSIDQGYKAARAVGVSLLAALLAEIGDLDRVERIVKVEGYVNCSPDFEKQSQVINGCSDLLVEVFGEKGRHARFAVGASSLPFGAPVEISAIVEISDD
ncbi:RidA family protein [Pelagicoccus sp. SDUM812003]|uniref:RidA family protein n=1 Tax=Pelagicoccus sp. SDUM812003 TaxID=3041267 RepID=UPI00280D0883|nr:RidA family protein [Pelagicoccus sp. SDUM812003]MDQ8203768.1 RidA family protein [Pelagicoccus sp. SDUM812003]